MNIILSSMEVSPYAKTGGLADVCNYLPKEWKKMGHNVIVVLPKYKFIDLNRYNFSNTGIVVPVPVANHIENALLWKGLLPDSDVEVFLVEYDQYFNRDHIYGDGSEYMDNDRRFIFFSRAIFHVAKVLNFTPDIIHSNDYHLAPAMAMLKLFYRFEPMFSKTAGVFTIHNLAYQGKFNQYRVMEYLGISIDNFYKDSWFEYDGVVNFMKTGIMFADKITTVSPNYSNEIRLPYYGEGMNTFLNQRSYDLIGILNGVDYDEWNPEIDDLIYSKYNQDDFSGKNINKIELFKYFGLNPENNTHLPLLGMVTRLTEQKGIDIIREPLERLLEKRQIKFAILGSGQNYYIDFFNYLKHRYPDEVITYIGYDNTLSHKIIAASDFFVMPSRFEPCGLTQMYSLKYGTLPIVRSTGGLADTVQEYNYNYHSGNGIVFNNFVSDDFEFAVNRAISLYYQSEHFNNARKNAIQKDYSSYSSALKYIDVFKWAKEKV